ncbi:MAG: hypothetical protein ACE5KM_16975 [Planctomycetaceae bacterium]
MITAIVFVVVALLIGYVFDRMARAARLRRNKRYDWYLAGIATVLGAGLGWMDGEGAGVGIGAAVGFFGGTLAASIVFGTLSVVWTLIRGPLPKRGRENRRTTMGHRLGILVAGLLPVAFAVVIAHETYWMCNLVALAAQNDVGLSVAGSAGSQQPREKLKATVADRRWHVAAATWRPMQWLLQPEILDATRAELAFLDLIDGRKPPQEKPGGWADLSDRDPVWTTWNMAGFDESFLRDETLHDLAMSICRRRLTLYSDCVERTWVLRYVPTGLFVRARQPQAGRPGPEKNPQ